MWTSANRDKDALALKHPNIAGVGGDLDAVRIEEARRPECGLHRVTGELMLQHIDLVVERHVQARH